MPGPGRDHAFDARWLAEALRLSEAAQPLDDDAAATAIARRHAGDGEARVLVRARMLGARTGMASLIEAWKARARLLRVVVALFAVGAGLGLAFAVLGDGSRPVNVVWALGGLLGVHVLSLLLWLVGLWLSGRGRANAGAFGRVWMWLTERLVPSRAGVHVTHALLNLHGRGGLTRWWLGTVTHGVWSLMLCGALLGLLMALAARGYGFVWETTILSSAVFERFVALLGWLPALLGFAVPDADLVRASGEMAASDETARRLWSSWLIGCVVVYGVVPRVLLWALCLAILAHGRVHLRLDLSLPDYARLLARLTPQSERMGVTDAAPRHIATAHVGAHGRDGRGAVLVGIELRTDARWPPLLPAGTRMAGVVDNREQRKGVLAALSGEPPARLLIACDPRLSPDRGSLALIAELAGLAGACRVWLRGAESADAARLAYWVESLGELGLARTDVIESEEAAVAWLGGAHED